MRDEKDPGTIEMTLPRRRGRPPKRESGAMTPAERARSYRIRVKNRASLVGLRGMNDQAPLVDLSDVQLLEAIRVAMQARANARVVALCDQLKRRYK